MHGPKTPLTLAVTGLGVGIITLGAGIIFQDHIQHQLLLATIASGSVDSSEVMFLDTSAVKKIAFDRDACVCPYCCQQP